MTTFFFYLIFKLAKECSMAELTRLNRECLDHVNQCAVNKHATTNLHVQFDFHTIVTFLNANRSIDAPCDEKLHEITKF